MSRKLPLGEVAKRALDTSIHAARSLAASRGALFAYERLLATTRSRTELLARHAVHDAYAANRALLAMALQHDDWLAPVPSWCPAPSRGRRQLASLAQHLFARYPLPEHLGSVWHEGEPGTITQEQRWYKRLGLGESLRRLDVPMPITRAMAHRFQYAPCHLGMVAALRWAQLTELGASDALTHEVLQTRLGKELDDETYWESVLRFFVSQPLLPLDEVGPLVDFLQHQRLAVKGRSHASLLRLVRDWHRELGRATDTSWAPAPLGGFVWVEKRRPLRDQRSDEEPIDEDRTWTITELCNSRALLIEGRAMRHCVATYVRACTSGQASIWSMQAETRHGKRRVLTIDIDPKARRVVQARRKCNAAPGASERAIVRRWAEREGLIIPPALRDLQ